MVKTEMCCVLQTYLLMHVDQVNLKFSIHCVGWIILLLLLIVISNFKLLVYYFFRLCVNLFSFNLYIKHHCNPCGHPPHKGYILIVNRGLILTQFQNLQEFYTLLKKIALFIYLSILFSCSGFLHTFTLLNYLYPLQQIQRELISLVVGTD